MHRSVVEGAKYTEAELQQALMSLRRDHREQLDSLRKDQDEALFKLRGEQAVLYVEKIAALEHEVQRLKDQHEKSRDDIHGREYVVVEASVYLEQTSDGGDGAENLSYTLAENICNTVFHPTASVQRREGLRAPQR